ncbi:MAG TPA: phosphomannomutase/phosphoglucomutase [bacterium]|nr:phosphomannomutase/phosphoglucomutase [bacterium]HPR86422.1 phosphomannomutase/phosphoglucomutase [bacterium]
MNEGIFREYDIRGVVRTDLTNDVAYNIGRAYGTWMGKRGHKRIAVGHDVRLTSPHLAKLFIDGVLTTGLDVDTVGEVMTPVLYFAIQHLKADGGVMITGSHNPIEYNGFKMCEGLAPIYGPDIQALKQIILKSAFVRTSSGHASPREIYPAYLEMMRSKFTFGRKLKVVIDAGNGAAGPIAPELWSSLGLEVVPLYCDPDGHFPNHLPDPTVPRFMQDLRQLVLAEKADLGIGYDGDADRVGIVDDRGRLVYADALMALLSREVLNRHPGSTILFDVKCSQLLPEEISRLGGTPLMYKTGHSLLKAKMKELHAPFAGEMSGHLFFADEFFGFDDGLYASGRLMRLLASGSLPFSALADQLPAFVSTPELRVDCPDREKFAVIDEMVKTFSASYETITIDGARVLFGDGWGLIRASNTQPVLVLRFEAKTRERLAEIVAVFRREMDKFPAIVYDPQEFAV